MRVALVVPDLRPESGGPARNVPALANALGACGVAVELHTTGPVPATPSGDNVMFRPARGSAPRRLGRSPEMLAQLMTSTADLIHAHCLWMFPLGYAVRAASNRRVPLLISPRGMLAPWSLRRARWKKALASRLIHPGAFRTAAAWHATSAQEARDIGASGYPQRIFVIPNGVDTAADPTEALAYYRANAPEAVGRRVLLFYSRFHSKKRVLEMLAAFARTAVALTDWHLLLVGIPEEYSVAQLRAEAQKLGVSRRTSVLDGLHAPKPYPMAELMALPSHDENFGQVVVEALRAGVPVITTTGTPWGELNNIHAGRWVEPAAFATELEELMKRSPEELRLAGERGRHWARATFDWRAVGLQMADAYREVLSTWKGSTR